MQTMMRQQMVETLEDMLLHDKRMVIVLADISDELFHSQRQEVRERLFNLGIMEQTMISVGAGFALEGFIPVMHSFVPFLVERPFEQIKDDFCYQQLSGKFISTGASYDYSTEGMTHQGPGDVHIMHGLPGMQIVVPGTPAEFDTLFRESYGNGANTYYRLSLSKNPFETPTQFGKLTVVRRGTQATVIAVGPMLAPTLAAVEDMDVTVLYCTTVAPFDGKTLREVGRSSNIVVVEPYYEGALARDICAAMQNIPMRLESIGVPYRVLEQYGTPQDHDADVGLTPRGIRGRIARFLQV
ncbi:MAG TPA: transketolase C-terminal domain-containing protein [Ktedonobacteraceae bacterium]|nr:transketolase C-terminal domain-containing protein [Ktedonobacteraceae bacterium]